MSKLIRATAVAVGIVGVLATAGPAAGLAPPRPAHAGCFGHGLTVTPVGHETMVDTYVDNECRSDVSLTITYRALGPCSHTSTIDVTVIEGAWDVVTFFTGPCPGHYAIRQRLVSAGRKVGQDISEFDAPG
jgi:hypothetical protein